MKVFENIQKSDYLYKEKLTEIVNELIPIRGSEKDIKRYYDENLSSDIRLKKWKDERKDAILNDCLDINPHLSSFKLGEKEIPHNEAPMYRYALLGILSDDKYSFGYVYWLLASERNRELEYACYCCKFGNDCIDYAITFDIEETLKEYQAFKDEKECYNYISTIISKSDVHPYQGELKEQFSKVCNGLLERSLRMLAITAPKQKEGETSENSNKTKIDRENLKRYFKSEFKGIGNGKIDRFTPFCEKIESRQWNGKEIAMIARMIYESIHSNNIPTSGYESWHRLFCQLTNTNYVRYRLNQAEPSDEIRNNLEIFF